MIYKLLSKCIYKDLSLGLLAIACILFASCSTDRSSQENSANSPSKITSTSRHTNKENKTSAKSKKITSIEDKDSSSLVELEDPPQLVKLQSKSQPTSCSEAKKWEGTWDVSATYADKLALISLKPDQEWQIFELNGSDLPTSKMDIEVKKVSDSTALPEGIQNDPPGLTHNKSNNNQSLSTCPDIQKWVGTWQMSAPYNPPATVILHPDYRWSFIQHNELGIPYRLWNIDAKKISTESTSLHPKSVELLAKRALQSIMSFQKNYRGEHSTFAASLNELNIGVRFDAEDFYDIRIASANAKRAYITAKSKRLDTKSVSGVITAKNSTYQTKICGTKSASQSPPPIDCHLPLSDIGSHQPAKTREAAVRSNLGSMNRAQQAYRQKNSTYAKSFDALDKSLGMNTARGLDIDEHYEVKIVSADASRVYVTARSKDLDTKSFSLVVSQENGRTNTKICKTESASQTPPPINCD